MEELLPSPTVAAPQPRPWTVFASGSFRKLWAATTLSLFGDFFSYIALAWLPDAGGVKSGSVGAGGVSARVKRVHGGGRERVRLVLVEVQVDVRQ